MNLNYSNKKGSSDLIYLFISVIILALLIPSFNYVMGTFNDVIQNTDSPTKAKEVTNTLSNSWIDSGDIIFAMIYFALHIGAIILSYFLDTHPLFIVGGVLIFIVLTWLGIIFANSYIDVTAAGTPLGDEMNNLPMLNFIMTWFAELNIFLMVAVLIVLYRRNT